MRAIRFLLTLLLTVVLFSFQTKKDKSSDFYIIFGSGFRNDTVSLVMNEVPLITNVILKSDTIGDVSRDVSIHFKSDTLFVLDNTLKIVKRLPLRHNNTLRFILTINKMPYDLMADLKKGKYIVISKHWYYYNVYLNQFKKTVILE